MNFVILDMEWNGALSRKEKRFLNEIIEFGAIKFNENMEILDSFSMLVRPQIGKRLSVKVKDLTHISNEELRDGGTTFTRVLSKFKKFAGDSVLLTWGRTDIRTLIENNDYYLKTEKIDFLTKYADIQKYCAMCLNVDISRQMGLQTAAELLGVCQDGVEHHRAYDDSYLSYECFKRLYDKEKFAAFIEDAENPDFYGRMLFKTVTLLDINDPLIDKTQMFMDCQYCGERAEQKSKWMLKNKRFCASFYCKKCKKSFVGRIQFKQKYDGVVISKKAVYPEENSISAAANMAVVCFLTESNGSRVLLLNNDQNTEANPPYGFVKNGEDAFKAAERVISEQTGFKAEQLILCGAVDNYRSDSAERELVLVFKTDKLIQGQPQQPDKSSKFVWTDLSELKNAAPSNKLNICLNLLNNNISNGFISINADN